MRKIGKIFNFSSKREIIGVIALALIISAPFFTFAKDKKIYVDDSAGATQDGSSAHPYKTIKQATKKAKKNTEIHILPGYYKENVEIPEGVEVYGSSKKSIVIEAKDDDKPTVEMDDKTKINKVTIKKGKYGIEVGKNDRASIVECVIENNDKDGIRVKGDRVSDKEIVSITDNIIHNNGRAGIYSEKRRLVLIDNDIYDNDKDGAALAVGVSAWIDDNKFKDNNRSGLSVVLDGSNIIIASKNNFSHNDKNGIEVNSYGRFGKLEIKKSKIHGNKDYGIARVERGSFPDSIWSNVRVLEGVEFWSNKNGNISNIFSL